MLYCGIVGHGDWYALIQGSQPPWLGRGVLCVAGLLLYFASERLVASELHWIVNGAGGWESRVRSLMLVCYLAGGAIACAGAIFDPYGPSEILNSAALSSLVAAIGLLQVPLFFGRFADKAGVTESNVQRSRAWTLAAVGASAFYVCVLGPGIRF